MHVHCTQAPATFRLTSHVSFLMAASHSGPVKWWNSQCASECPGSVPFFPLLWLSILAAELIVHRIAELFCFLTLATYRRLLDAKHVYCVKSCIVCTPLSWILCLQFQIHYYCKLASRIAFVLLYVLAVSYSYNY